MDQAQPHTTGYVERAILNRLVTDGYNTEILTTDELTSHVGVVREHGSQWAQLSAKQQGADDEIAASTVRHAANRLEQKDLLQRLSDVTVDTEYDSFYTGKRQKFGVEDQRKTAWTLTRDGADEVKRLDEAYREELLELLKRFGRASPTERMDE